MLDTNVISELRKPKAEGRVVEFVSSTPLFDLYVSAVSLAEIRFGIELSPDAQRRAALQDWLMFKVRPMFDPLRTLPVTEDILLKWRVLLEAGRKTGHTFCQPDLLIAATAAHHGLTVVTRDQIHFDRAGVPVLNPWDL
ncbi:MAG: type II toxin-antitoxin system VapC family toxin [Bryobacteraceae bacterium]|nr:type II toxin-antitoxin system VapC family toxin [Bryobacteraceae bacterium]